ncbi:unnamed protein product [Acanthoscelides obtectus]|uniref:PiggyBac transposable element-derived protein domain-containing protein n=1 Tax=Acanthoscelides obtectus TaxID=200917 RepID=A0A9P0PAR0_ACAOB|nr:unnamed protein product [Acanthoscelides obtectus]CAK1627668.1 PiggyBac transposable element-derived protein 4 [Acanthoscelides obtectus]
MRDNMVTATVSQMSNSRPLTQAELEEIVANISYQGYCASGYGGDDDAEDDLPPETPTSSRSSSVRLSSGSPAVLLDSQPGPSYTTGLRKKLLAGIPPQSMTESEDEDYHDSDADPDFDPNDPPNKIAKFFPQDSKLSSEDEDENEISSAEIIRQRPIWLWNCKAEQKEFPKTDKELSQNQSDSVASGEISVYKWKDRGVKCVAVASNRHNFLEKTEVLRTNKIGQRDNVTCPKAIADYNIHMGGVDLFDQYHENYSTSWKSRRWWIKFFYYLLDASIVNSYVLYKKTLKSKNPSAKPLTALQFRSELANELIGTFTQRKKAGPEKTETQSNIGSHLATKGTYRRCVLCSSSKKK